MATIQHHSTLKRYMFCYQSKTADLIQPDWVPKYQNQYGIILKDFFQSNNLPKLRISISKKISLTHWGYIYSSMFHITNTHTHA